MTKTPSPTSSRSCCENGRPILADPHTGQTICSCQYNPALLGYSRLAGLPDGVYGSPAYTAQGLVPFASEGSAFYSPLVSILLHLYKLKSFSYCHWLYNYFFIYKPKLMFKLRVSFLIVYNYLKI